MVFTLGRVAVLPRDLAGVPGARVAEPCREAVSPPRLWNRDSPERLARPVFQPFSVCEALLFYYDAVGCGRPDETFTS